MNKNFKSLSIVYGIINEAQELGSKAYLAEKQGNNKRFQTLLYEAYVKIISAIPLMQKCSPETRSTVFLMASWYSCDLQKYKECQGYIENGILVKFSNFNDKYKKIQNQLNGKLKISSST